jgi:hypothetical protein
VKRQFTIFAHQKITAPRALMTCIALDKYVIIVRQRSNLASVLHHQKDQASSEYERVFHREMASSRHCRLVMIRGLSIEAGNSPGRCSELVSEFVLNGQINANRCNSHFNYFH